jgi:hypothetical protein
MSVAKNFKKQIPLGRLGDVNETVNAAPVLASPMASYLFNTCTRAAARNYAQGRV